MSRPFSGCRGLVSFSRSRNASQPARSTATFEVLCRIAAGRVDQHGVLGEPPIAQASASHACDGPLAHLLRQRKAQAGVQQRRCLAGAGRADDGVPRLFIQVAATAQRGLQQVQCGGQPRPQRLRLIGLLRTRRDSLCQSGVAPPPADVEQRVSAAPHQEQCDDDREPRRQVLEVRQQRCEEPHEAREQGDPGEADAPASDQRSGLRPRVNPACRL